MLFREHPYFSVLGLGSDTGCAGGCAGASGETEPAGVGVIGREGVSHDRFSSPSTFLLGCWVDCCFLAICVTSFGPPVLSTI